MVNCVIEIQFLASFLLSEWSLNPESCEIIIIIVQQSKATLIFLSDPAAGNPPTY